MEVGQNGYTVYVYILNLVVNFTWLVTWRYSKMCVN